jgi:hypothetical protein
MRRTAAILALSLALPAAACGQKTKLEPLAGHTLPPAPYGAQAKPDAEALLTPPVQAAPQRSVELRTRSEEREDDAFDLPPE